MKIIIKSFFLSLLYLAMFNSQLSLYASLEATKEINYESNLNLTPEVCNLLRKLDLVLLACRQENYKEAQKLMLNLDLPKLLEKNNDIIGIFTNVKSKFKSLAYKDAYIELCILKNKLMHLPPINIQNRKRQIEPAAEESEKQTRKMNSEENQSYFLYRFSEKPYGRLVSASNKEEIIYDDIEALGENDENKTHGSIIRHLQEGKYKGSGLVSFQVYSKGTGDFSYDQCKTRFGLNRDYILIICPSFLKMFTKVKTQNELEVSNGSVKYIENEIHIYNAKDFHSLKDNNGDKIFNFNSHETPNNSEKILVGKIPSKAIICMRKKEFEEMKFLDFGIIYNKNHLRFRLDLTNGVLRREVLSEAR